MGKRTLHGASYQQCDWTGCVMKSSPCYLPVWNLTKLSRRGAYLNWECVIAHARFIAAAAPDGHVYGSPLAAVEEHVASVVGLNVRPAPHYSRLSHMGGALSLEEFHEECKRGYVIRAVALNDDGARELDVEPHGLWDTFLRLDGLDTGVHIFFPLKKRVRPGVDVAVCYQKSSMLSSVNKAASALFKHEIRGTVLLVFSTKEQCYTDRRRLLPLTFAQYEQLFLVRKRRKNSDVCVTSSTYPSVRADMLAEFARFEKAASAGAEAPCKISNAQVTPPVSGWSLAQAYPCPSPGN